MKSTELGDYNMRDKEENHIEIAPAKPPSLSREFLLFFLALVLIIGVFFLLAFRIDIPTWLIIIVSNVGTFFFGYQSSKEKSI